MVYWHATKQHTSFRSNNEQLANRYICSELYGSDSINIQKGKQAEKKVGFPIVLFLADVKVPHRRAFLLPCTLSLMSLSN